MFGFKRSNAKKLIAEARALAKTKPDQPRNFIHCSDGEPAIISIHVNGERLAWIEFDRYALEDLIAMLTAQRHAMDKKTSP